MLKSEFFFYRLKIILYNIPKLQVYNNFHRLNYAMQFDHPFGVFIIIRNS